MLIERITLVDQVVLVPDLATWLDEVGRWKKGAQWPVLIEDDRYTPLFVRRFKPLRLIGRSSIGEELPSDAKAIKYSHARCGDTEREIGRWPRR